MVPCKEEAQRGGGGAAVGTHGREDCWAGQRGALAATCEGEGSTQAEGPARSRCAGETARQAGQGYVALKPPQQFGQSGSVPGGATSD